MKKAIRYLLMFFACTNLLSCERDIDLELPDTEPILVVEGRIEPGIPPLVILTHSQGYFEPTDAQTLSSLFIKDAKVSINDGSGFYELQLLCTKDLDPAIKPFAAELLGIDTNTLNTIDYCIYTSLDPSHFGSPGKTYDLKIEHQSKVYTSTSGI